jgi:hypothetical protein
MSAACERVRAMLPEYGLEALQAARRDEVREHLRGCAACRAEAASEDPTLLFAGLPPDAVSAEVVASVVASVRAGIALKQAERRIARHPAESAGQRRRQSARVVAAAVILLTLAVPAGLRSPSAPALTAQVSEVPAAGLSAAVAEHASAPKAPGAATVYDWNPGVGEPRVVWIVDGSLDI